MFFISAQHSADFSIARQTRINDRTITTFKRKLGRVTHYSTKADWKFSNKMKRREKTKVKSKNFNMYSFIRIIFTLFFAAEIIKKFSPGKQLCDEQTGKQLCDKQRKTKRKTEMFKQCEEAAKHMTSEVYHFFLPVFTHSPKIRSLYSFIHSFLHSFLIHSFSPSGRPKKASRECHNCYK